MTETKRKAGGMHGLVNEGCIGLWYGKTDFLRVTPVLTIDKVKFDFVKVGSNGQSFAVWVDTDTFDNFCSDILSGRFMSALKNDNGPYPEAFKYMTGENGSNLMQIGKGNTGILAHAQIIGGGKSANVPICKSATLGRVDYKAPVEVKQANGIRSGYGELMTMAKLWTIVSGQTLVTGYYAILLKDFQNAQEKQQDWRKSYDEARDGAVDMDVVEDLSSAPAPVDEMPWEPTQASASAAQNAPAKAAPAPQNSAANAVSSVPRNNAQEAQNQPVKPQQKPEVLFDVPGVPQVSGRFNVVSEIKSYNETYMAKVSKVGDSFANTRILYFPKKSQSFNEPGRLDAMIKKAERGDLTISIYYKDGFSYRGGSKGMLFCGFAV